MCNCDRGATICLAGEAFLLLHCIHSLSHSLIASLAEIIQYWTESCASTWFVPACWRRNPMVAQQDDGITGLPRQTLCVAKPSIASKDVFIIQHRSQWQQLTPTSQSLSNFYCSDLFCEDFLLCLSDVSPL